MYTEEQWAKSKTQRIQLYHFSDNTYIDQCHSPLCTDGTDGTGRQHSAYFNVILFAAEKRISHDHCVAPYGAKGG